MTSDFCGFSVEFLPNPYVESAAIWLVGRIPSFFTICKITVNGLLEGCFDFLDSLALIGNDVFNEEDLSMQTTILNACLNSAGVAFVGKLVHNITPICLSAFFASRT